MVERVLLDQQTVAAQYQPDNILEGEKVRFRALQRSIEFRISKVQRLAKDALAVEESVST